MPFFSTSLTVISTKLPVTNNRPLVRRVSQMQIVVRNMGTATYIAIGGSDSQDRRLTSVGASVSIDVAGQGRYFDPLSIFVLANGANAAIEIFGEAV